MIRTHGYSSFPTLNIIKLGVSNQQTYRDPNKSDYGWFYLSTGDFDSSGNDEMAYYTKAANVDFIFNIDTVPQSNIGVDLLGTIFTDSDWTENYFNHWRNATRLFGGDFCTSHELDCVSFYHPAYYPTDIAYFKVAKSIDGSWYLTYTEPIFNQNWKFDEPVYNLWNAAISPTYDKMDELIKLSLDGTFHIWYHDESYNSHFESLQLELDWYKWNWVKPANALFGGVLGDPEETGKAELLAWKAENNSIQIRVIPFIESLDKFSQDHQQECVLVDSAEMEGKDWDALIPIEKTLTNPDASGVDFVLIDRDTRSILQIFSI